MSDLSLKVTVVGAGLAGCEAAWQMAERGIAVELWEQKPEKHSPAHRSGDFAELVCSNSLRAEGLGNAPGLLKEEMRRLGGLIMRCADATRVAAGGALAVDREAFAAMVTKAVREHPNITLRQEECTGIPDGPVIIATGPLTEGAMAEAIDSLIGSDTLRFYDASAPLVVADTIDMEKAFFAARYDNGTPDYINCPMSKEEYYAFQEALSGAATAHVHGFEENMVFEGCMPIEVMAHRGVETIAHGMLKPVGLPDPRTGKLAYAVVQLRRDNAEGTLYNLVGFQTHLTFPEQKRVFSMIPGLEHAEFARYGVMHRNTFINSPRLLDRGYALRSEPRIRFAGQMTGVEGYIESASSGMLAGIGMAFSLRGLPEPDFTSQTGIGSLAHYISESSVGDFEPMNVNFGLMDPLPQYVRKKSEKKLRLSERALETLERVRAEAEEAWNRA